MEPMTIDFNKRGPCKNIFNARQFLKQTYMIENLREDFLKSELEKLCGREITAEFEEEVTVPIIYT